MYCTLKYCGLAISKNFSHDYIKPEIVKLATNLEVQERQMHPACSRHPQVQQLHLHQGPQDNHPNVFLEDNTSVCQPTSKLASFVFQLKGHAAPKETLFSSLFKTQNQEKMMTDNLKIIGSFCKSLKDGIPTWCKNDRKRDKTVVCVCLVCVCA